MRAGPERRKLKIKDAERYGWQPKEMLAQIASIYIHLGRADGQGIFAAAIADDERSFRQEMFAEASKVRLAHFNRVCTVFRQHSLPSLDDCYPARGPAHSHQCSDHQIVHSKA